jgi:hypothetical protein
MNQQRIKPSGSPLRVVGAAERSEKLARQNGWVGRWPPKRTHIASAGDCETHLARLELGEARAGIVRALGIALVAFFDKLQPQDFQRFAKALLQVARDGSASDRTRLRATEAAIRPLHDALPILLRLKQCGDSSLQAHLERCLAAFCEEISAEGFGQLGEILVELAETGARTSNKVRAVAAALRLLTSGLGMLLNLQRLAKNRPLRAPERDRPEISDKVTAELAEMDKRLLAQIAEKAAAKAAGRDSAGNAIARNRPASCRAP